MIHWFKRKEYPDFWHRYKSHFKSFNKPDLENTRFIVFDTETTGLNVVNDRILSIGAVAVKNNFIDVSDSFEIYLNQEKYNATTVEIHGILKEGKLIKADEGDAVVKFLEYIKESVLVAHHTAFDMAMINEALKRMKLPKLKNRSIDTGYLFKKLNNDTTENKHYALDELCVNFNIPMHDRHTATGDAFITALLFLKLKKQLLAKGFTLHDFFIKSPKRGLL
ncbi:3'-5' exonuclease [Abyssalbus ytuae]|uniref:3'-5' exonuclease n=1 Tax=Abyssalbus ytuae TaxID=2926907 RepID=A0A9E6ZK36_9FLAO|nr:3'-5' exonuclease [Abyssalbus ytuae]UOB17117.1 3'-5' exonuclease [Abyssalbus ytuae]